MMQKMEKLTEVRSEELLKFKMFLLFMMLISLGISLFSQNLKEEIVFQLSWDKDFELILELNNVPTRGEVARKKEKQSLEKEKNELIKKKEILEKRLEKLNNPVFTDELYDEMLLEETNDISSTKESIQKKLDDVNERINEINSRLRKLGAEK